jgi:hypothetical protein
MACQPTFTIKTRPGILSGITFEVFVTFRPLVLGVVIGARAYALIYAGIHGAEDHGTITTYLRMQGLVPPSTALVTK